MEYIYAVRLLDESGRELNERNLTAVLEAAGCTVAESRVKALVAALEGVDIGEVDTVDTGADTDAVVPDDEGDAAPTDGGHTPEE
jgi:large subunit ribosomal protein L12